MWLESKSELGRGIGFHIENGIDIQYANMVTYLDNAVRELENVLKKTDDSNLDKKIKLDLKMLYEIVYSMYDKYYIIAYENGEQKS